MAKKNAKKGQELSDQQLDQAAGGVTAPRPIREVAGGKSVLPNVPNLSKGQIKVELPSLPDPAGPLAPGKIIR